MTISARITQYFSLFFSLLLLTACASEVQRPANFTEVKDAMAMYPDYQGVTIPPNIAPLNFMVHNKGEAYIAEVAGKKGELLAEGDANGKFSFDTTAWRNLLTQHRGEKLNVRVFVKRPGHWVAMPPTTFEVAQEPIDSFLSYRLIEPGYELYRQVGLYQRNLTNFEERPIYENNREYDSENNHCVNCHNFQSYDTERMLFHVRSRHGGTVFVNGDKVQKLNMKSDSVLANSVYPSWHPHQNWVVFSTNKTGQAFHIAGKKKVEVVDYGSDLVFFDVDKLELTNIFKTKNVMETFPAWSPDGKRLFYCAATVKGFQQVPDSLHSNVALNSYDSIYYNIYSIPFDAQTRTFGEPVLEVDCASEGRSATVPRISPDGRYLLYTLGGFGQFHIWHKDADQWVKDLQTGQSYALTPANSDEVDSYHTWSSNGRWIVFSSRREDGNYTRPAIAYFDPQGQARKAFILPQADAEYHELLLRSYNVPELTRKAVRISPEQFREVIYNDAGTQNVTYRSAHP